MDVGKLKGLTIGDLVARAQALGEKKEPDNPDFADNLALSLVKSVVHGTEDLGPIIDLFGSDDDISSGLFPDDNAVSVTETSVSLPKDTEINRDGIAGDMTPEEEQMLDQAINPEEDDVFDKILNANTDEELQAALGITGDNKPAEDQPANKPAEDQPANKPAEDQPANKPPADFSDTDKTSAEEAAEQPKEEKPAESKPEEKKKEKVPEEEKPKETSKDESDDTMKNITSALSDRF